MGKYAALREEAERTGGKIFFADEAHFRADAELRGKWTLKGEPALVDSSSPRYGERASYYSAVCLETGEVERMELEGNSNSETSAYFLKQLGERHHGPLQVIWGNAPAHRGEVVREYLQTPGLGLRLVNLPGYSPDFNADEAIWGWAREEATGNLCLGTRAVVRERVGSFLAGLARRKEEGPAALPNSPAIKSRSAPASLPARFPSSGKCTSHFGFSLVLEKTLHRRTPAISRSFPVHVRDRKYLLEHFSNTAAQKGWYVHTHDRRYLQLVMPADQLYELDPFINDPVGWTLSNISPHLPAQGPANIDLINVLLIIDPQHNARYTIAIIVSLVAGTLTTITALGQTVILVANKLPGGL